MSIYCAISLLFVAIGFAMCGELSAQEKEGPSPMSVNQEADLLSAYPQTEAFTSNVDWHKKVGENEVRMSWFLSGNPGVAMVCTANPTTSKVVTAREVYEHATQSEMTRKLSDAQAATLGNLIKQLSPSAKHPELENLIVVTILKKGLPTTYLYDRLDMPQDIVRLYDVTGAYVVNTAPVHEAEYRGVSKIDGLGEVALPSGTWILERRLKPEDHVYKRDIFVLKRKGKRLERLTFQIVSRGAKLSVGCYFDTICMGTVNGLPQELVGNKNEHHSGHTLISPVDMQSLNGIENCKRALNIYASDTKPNWMAYSFVGEIDDRIVICVYASPHVLSPETFENIYCYSRLKHERHHTANDARPNETTNEPQAKANAGVNSDIEMDRKQTAKGDDSNTLTHAPAELHAILQRDKSRIDFRSVAQDGYAYDGCYWRIDSNDNLLQAHIKHFDLKPVSQGRLTEKMFRKFPADWPDLSDTNLQWYAWDGNRDDGNLKLWSIMAVDAVASKLYFFHQNYDVTP